MGLRPTISIKKINDNNMKQIFQFEKSLEISQQFFDEMLKRKINFVVSYAGDEPMFNANEFKIAIKQNLLYATNPELIKLVLGSARVKLAQLIDLYKNEIKPLKTDPTGRNKFLIYCYENGGTSEYDQEYFDDPIEKVSMNNQRGFLAEDLFVYLIDINRFFETEIFTEKTEVLSKNLIKYLEEEYFKIKLPKLNWKGTQSQFKNLLVVLEEKGLINYDSKQWAEFMTTCIWIKGKQIDNQNLQKDLSRKPIRLKNISGESNGIARDAIRYEGDAKTFMPPKGSRIELNLY